MKRIGVFSEEKYIIETFDQLFDHAWDQDQATACKRIAEPPLESNYK
jgi:hypothetical protein